MDDPIFPRARFYAKGRAAALRGDSRDSHQMNWHALALPVWHQGYNSVSQQSHIAPAGRARIELAQGEAA